MVGEVGKQSNLWTAFPLSLKQDTNLLIASSSKTSQGILNVHLQVLFIEGLVLFSSQSG
jgi:hypothetical protein